MLGLLSDDYQVTSPIKEAKTIVIERTGEMIKQVKTAEEENNSCVSYLQPSSQTSWCAV